jgi:hypothetical protein
MALISKTNLDQMYDELPKKEVLLKPANLNVGTEFEWTITYRFQQLIREALNKMSLDRFNQRMLIRRKQSGFLLSPSTTTAGGGDKSAKINVPEAADIAIRNFVAYIEKTEGTRIDFARFRAYHSNEFFGGNAQTKADIICQQDDRIYRISVKLPGKFQVTGLTLQNLAPHLDYAFKEYLKRSGAERSIVEKFKSILLQLPKKIVNPQQLALSINSGHPASGIVDKGALAALEGMIPKEVVEFLNDETNFEIRKILAAEWLTGAHKYAVGGGVTGHPKTLGVAEYLMTKDWTRHIDERLVDIIAKNMSIDITGHGFDVVRDSLLRITFRKKEHLAMIKDLKDQINAYAHQLHEAVFVDRRLFEAQGSPFGGILNAVYNFIKIGLIDYLETGFSEIITNVLKNSRAVIDGPAIYREVAGMK